MDLVGIAGCSVSRAVIADSIIRRSRAAKARSCCAATSVILMQYGMLSNATALEQRSTARETQGVYGRTHSKQGPAGRGAGRRGRRRAGGGCALHRGGRMADENYIQMLFVHRLEERREQGNGIHEWFTATGMTPHCSGGLCPP